jgi:hypothetical protein
MGLLARLGCVALLAIGCGGPGVDTGGATNGGGPAPPGQDAGGPTVVIAAAGDIACPSCDQLQTANVLDGMLALEDLAAVLAVGDNAYPRGVLSDYVTEYGPSWGQPPLLAITHPVPGNHEYTQGDGKAGGYFDYFDGVGAADGRAGQRGKGYYSFNVGTWHIVALNSSNACSPVHCEMGSDQQQWLAADLAANPAPCTLAYWHHPRFQQGTVHGDLPAIAPLWNTLYDAGADLVIEAHEHNYQQLAPLDKDGNLDPARGIRSFVVGTGGSEGFYTSFGAAHADAVETRVVKTNGVLELTLRPGGYDFRFVTVTGQVPSGASGSGACH